jgi:hypothetical protein
LPITTSGQCNGLTIPEGRSFHLERGAVDEHVLGSSLQSPAASSAQSRDRGQDRGSVLRIDLDPRHARQPSEGRTVADDADHTTDLVGSQQERSLRIEGVRRLIALAIPTDLTIGRLADPRTSRNFGSRRLPPEVNGVGRPWVVPNEQAEPPRSATSPRLRRQPPDLCQRRGVQVRPVLTAGLTPSLEADLAGGETFIESATVECLPGLGEREARPADREPDRIEHRHVPFGLCGPHGSTIVPRLVVMAGGA